MGHGYLYAVFFFHMVGIHGLLFLAANNDIGRFSRRAGYQNDSFRGRGNFSGGNFCRGRGILGFFFFFGSRVFNFLVVLFLF